DLLLAARKDSPLVIGIGDGEIFIASDIPAVLPYTREVMILEDGDIAVIRREGATVTQLDGSPVARAPMRVTWDAAAAEKGGYDHFMLKEIHEQPATIRDTLRGRLADGHVDLSELGLAEEQVCSPARARAGDGGPALGAPPAPPSPRQPSAVCVPAPYRARLRGTLRQPAERGRGGGLLRRPEQVQAALAGEGQVRERAEALHGCHD